MRIIAGQNRGRKLKAVPGMKTRPTADRVKEAVFSSIDSMLYGGSILDVFSGTGSIALEAVSRGAKCAVLIEQDPDALKVIAENIRLCGQEEACTVCKGDALRQLKQLAAQKQQFDVIYLDPPYQAGLYAHALQCIAEGQLLRQNGVILVESAKNTSHSVENSIFFIYKEKYYGDTKVTYFKYNSVNKEESQ